MEEEQNSDITTETDDCENASSETVKEGEPKSRFPDLDELQQQITKRIKSNRKFLDTYLIEDIDAAADDMDLPDDEESIADDEESSGDETFEEL